MSSMEPSMFSYLSFHTEKMGVTAEELERMRIAAQRSSPLHEAVQLCLGQVTSPLSAPSQPPLSPSLSAPSPLMWVPWVLTLHV